MLFRVDFENFVVAVNRLVGAKVAATAVREGRTVITASDPKSGVIVATSTAKPISEARSLLTGWGFEVIMGEFTNETSVDCQDENQEDDFWVAAVSYRSREDMPGLWVEAFGYEPTHGEVLKAIFEEFSNTGEIQGSSFDEFVRVGVPNVVILRRADLQRMAKTPEIDAN